jgi:RNA polymerase sigma-70 factor (ECF subfamily)
VESSRREVNAEPRFVFRDIFDAHAQTVWRTLYSLGIHPASIDDALQDVFLVVHEKIDEFEGRSHLATWIYAVTYRVAQNYRRRIRRRAHEELSETARCSRPTPEHLMANREAAAFVNEFCSRLSEEKRDVFVLCVLEERSAPDVATILGVNINTVYSRTRSARSEFREALSKVAAASAVERKVGVL